MTSKRFWTAVFLVLGSLGVMGTVVLVLDPDVDIASKVATGLVGAVATALLWQPFKSGAVTFVLSAGGMALLAVWGGTIVRVLVGLVVLAVAAIVLTRNRPVHITVTLSSVLRVPPAAAFDAVMGPHDGIQEHVEIRDRVRLPNGGSSCWLVIRRPLSPEGREHHIDTEWDPPHRGATEATMYQDIDGVATRWGNRSIVTTFSAVAGGTRVTKRQEVWLEKGGLYSRFAFKVVNRRVYRRYFRRAEELAKANAAGTAERVPDPEAGPYLQPDD